jgi:formiminotetrahydrofolate cyclodeaminase
MALPKATELEKGERSRQIQDALKQAVSPPLRIMRAASQVVELAAELIEVGNRSAVSDVGTAVVTAGAGYEAARFNVDINLHSVRDEAWTAQVRREVSDIRPIDQVVRCVVEQTQRIIRGEVG